MSIPITVLVMGKFQGHLPRPTVALCGRIELPRVDSSRLSVSVCQVCRVWTANTAGICIVNVGINGYTYMYV